MRHCLSFVFALVFATPVHAAGLNMKQARIVATFEEYNLTTNLIAHDGKLLIPDSQRDVLMVRGLADATSYEVPLSVERANFILGLEGTKVAISDPSFDKITVVDYAARRELSTYTYSDTFGPWHLAYYNGVIYGSNKGDQLINRYNPNTRRAQSNYQGGSGPAWLTAHHGKLFVLEQGGIGAPGDDKIAVYDLKAGQVESRELLDGSANEMVAWGEGVCISLSFSNKVQCGKPETKEWLEADAEETPWGLTVGKNQLWVLARGPVGVDETMIITYAERDGELKRLAAWKLRGMENLDLARSLAFDERTSTLLVRGIRSVYAIPVVE